jgi:hypothetical protein
MGYSLFELESWTMGFRNIGNKVVPAMIVFFLSTYASTMEGIGIHLRDKRPDPSERFRVSVPEISRITLAQNTAEPSGEDDQATIESENTSPESSSSTQKGSDAKPAEAETKPIRPFKPSEEIAAEQAVDFPWDI